MALQQGLVILGTIRSWQFCVRQVPGNINSLSYTGCFLFTFPTCVRRKTATGMQTYLLSIYLLESSAHSALPGLSLAEGFFTNAKAHAAHADSRQSQLIAVQTGKMSKEVRSFKQIFTCLNQADN